MKKLLYEEVYNFFKKENCELLEKEYINNTTKMKYKCKCGRISSIVFGNFKMGQRCYQCGGRKKWTYNDISQYFEKNMCELLDKEYIDNKTKMKYRCSCGNTSEITFSNFKKGRRCMECSGNKKFTFKYVFNFFKDKDCELLETEYKGIKTLMRYKCKCGVKAKIAFNCFRDGQRCHNCAIEKRAGVNHYNYNPNLTDEEREKNQTRVSDPLYNAWRTKVYKRDGHTCQKCLIRGGVLRGHHIKNWASNKELRYVVSNGITLCENCHNEFHSTYGKKNNNKEQISEFVNSCLIGV